MSGRFIVFEGGEGVGKSTQLRRLAVKLTKSGKKVTATREPGGTQTAEDIRRVILSGQAKPLGPEAEAILFAAARADHLAALIKPALAEGKWVLCDRFTDSTRVYQGVGGVDDALLNALDRVVVGETRPDLTILLDLPPKVGLRRVSRRSADAPDRFESEAIDLHERRRQAYLAIAARDPDRYAVIDAWRGEEEIAGDIWNAVAGRLLEKAA